MRRSVPSSCDRSSLVTRPIHPHNPVSVARTGRLRLQTDIGSISRLAQPTGDPQSRLAACRARHPAVWRSTPLFRHPRVAILQVLTHVYKAKNGSQMTGHTSNQRYGNGVPATARESASVGKPLLGWAWGMKTPRGCSCSFGVKHSLPLTPWGKRQMRGHKTTLSVVCEPCPTPTQWPSGDWHTPPRSRKSGEWNLPGHCA